MVFGPHTGAEQPRRIHASRALPERDTDDWYLALLGRQFPGSWLPSGGEQLVRCAEPHFRLVSTLNGRLDYIETIRRWNERVGARSPRKAMLKLALVPRWLSSADFRLAFTSGVSANMICFERGLLDHYRLVQQDGVSPCRTFGSVQGLNSVRGARSRYADGWRASRAVRRVGVAGITMGLPRFR